MAAVTVCGDFGAQENKYWMYDCIQLTKCLAQSSNSVNDCYINYKLLHTHTHVCVCLLNLTVWGANNEWIYVYYVSFFSSLYNYIKSLTENEHRISKTSFPSRVLWALIMMNHTVYVTVFLNVAAQLLQSGLTFWNPIGNSISWKILLRFVSLTWCEK